MTRFFEHVRLLLRDADIPGRGAACVRLLAAAALPLIVLAFLPDLLGDAAARWLGLWGAALVGFVCGVFADTLALSGAGRILDGGRFDVGKAASAGIRRFIPMVGAKIVLILSGLIGVIALVVSPSVGLRTLAGCTMALPACVRESLGVGRSFQRGEALGLPRPGPIVLAAAVLFGVVGLVSWAAGLLHAPPAICSGIDRLGFILVTSVFYAEHVGIEATANDADAPELVPAKETLVADFDGRRS